MGSRRTATEPTSKPSSNGRTHPSTRQQRARGIRSTSRGGHRKVLDPFAHPGKGKRRTASSMEGGPTLSPEWMQARRSGATQASQTESTKGRKEDVGEEASRRWEPSSPRAVRGTSKKAYQGDSFSRNYSKSGNEVLRGTDFGWRNKSNDHGSPGDGSFKDKHFSDRFRSPAANKGMNKKPMEKDRWFGQGKVERTAFKTVPGLSPPSPSERIRQFETRYQPSQPILVPKNKSTYVYSRMDLLKVYQEMEQEGSLSLASHANLEGIKASSPQVPYGNRLDKESQAILAQLQSGPVSPRGVRTTSHAGLPVTEPVQPAVPTASTRVESAISEDQTDLSKSSAVDKAAEEQVAASVEDVSLSEAGKKTAWNVSASSEVPVPSKQEDNNQNASLGEELSGQEPSLRGWCYLDPQGQVQGPFTSEEILDWFEQGFFPPNLPVRPSHMATDSPFLPLMAAIPQFGPAGTAFLENLHRGPFNQSQYQQLRHQQQQQQELLQRQYHLQQLQFQQQQQQQHMHFQVVEQQQQQQMFPGTLPVRDTLIHADAQRPANLHQSLSSGRSDQGSQVETSAPRQKAMDLNVGLQTMKLDPTHPGEQSMTGHKTMKLPQVSQDSAYVSSGGNMLTLSEIEALQMQQAAVGFGVQRPAVFPSDQSRVLMDQHVPLVDRMPDHTKQAHSSLSKIQAHGSDNNPLAEPRRPVQPKQGWIVQQQDMVPAKSLAEIQKEEAEKAARLEAELAERNAALVSQHTSSLQTPWSKQSSEQVKQISMKEIQEEEERKAKTNMMNQGGPELAASARNTSSPWGNQPIVHPPSMKSVLKEETVSEKAYIPVSQVLPGVPRGAAPSGRPATRGPIPSAWAAASNANAPPKSLKEIQEEETRRLAAQGGSRPAGFTLAERLGAQTAPKFGAEEELLWDYSKTEHAPKPPPAILSNVHHGKKAQAYGQDMVNQTDLSSTTVKPHLPSAKESTTKTSNHAPGSFGDDPDHLGHSISGSFRGWCKEQLLQLTGSDDLTLIDFLLGLQSSGEIAEYIQVYLGKSAAVSSFTAEFVRRKHAEEASKSSHQLTRGVGGPVDTETDFQEQTKNNRNKRSKGKKVNPSQMLGFSSGISYENVERGI